MPNPLTAPTPAGRRDHQHPFDLETPFGKIQPVFEGFSLATPGWMHEDSTLPSLDAEPSVRRSPRRQSQLPEQPQPAVQPTPRRSPRRSAWVQDDYEVEQPTPRRSARRRSTVERLGFPSMGDSTKESLAASMARSRSISSGPVEASPSKPGKIRAEGSAQREMEIEPRERETRTPAVAARAIRETRASTSTPSTSNDLYERRLLDSARRKTLLPLPGHDWADEGLASSTPAPVRTRRKSFRPSPERELVAAFPPAPVVIPSPVQPSEPPQTDSAPSETPRPQTPPPPSRSAPQQSTPENRFVLPPCVSTRKKRRMASPGKPLRASTESAPEAPAESSKPAQPKFLDELSQVIARSSTPEPTVAEAPKPASDRLSSSSSLAAASHPSDSSGKRKAKRTVIKIGAGGKIRTSAEAAELVAEQEESLRLEGSIDRSRDKSIDKTGEIADWSRNVLPADLVLRRSESLQSSSSRLTRHGNSSESREGTPVSLASLSSFSSRGSLPPRPQNPTPRTASPYKDRLDSSTSLPSLAAAPVFSDSSLSTSAPKRPSNPTPKHAHTIRAPESPAPIGTKLSMSTGDAEPAKPKQPLASSLNRPIKRFPARKAVPAPQVQAKPTRALPQPVAAAKPAPMTKALARKRQVSDPPQPQPQTFPARVRNGPPVLTPAKKTAKAAQPKTRLPVPAPASEERNAKRAKVAATEPEEPTGSTTPPHVVEALATPRRHSVTVRRTPRRTTPRRTPASVSGWPELGLNKEQTAFTFEHRLRQAAEESPAIDPPSISYPSYPSYPTQSARRESYATDADSDSEGDGDIEEDEEEVGVLNPMEEFEVIRPHGQELSAVLEVTEGEVSALSQRSAFTPIGRPTQVFQPQPQEESEDEYEDEPTPKAIVLEEPASEPIVVDEPVAEPTPEPEVQPEQEADTSASSSDSSLRSLGKGVLGFLASLVGTPTPAAPNTAAPVAAPAPLALAEVAQTQKVSKPTRAIKNKPVRAKDKENASAKPRTRPAPKPQPVKSSETKEKEVPRYALATAAARAHEQKQPAEKRKRDAGSPQRNVRRKVPAASALSTRPLRSLPQKEKSTSSRPIRSLPSTRSSSAATRSAGAARSVSATSAASAASSSSSTSRGPRTGSTVTAFTAAALARLPKPGETKAKASPVKIRDLERARDLAVRKAVFERFHPDADVSLSNMSFGSPAPAPPAGAPLGESSAANASRPKPATLNGKAKNLTIPMSGKTPGKASKLRAASRAKFDAKVARKAALKAKEEEERERIRRQVEEEMDRQRRKATVIRARPLPEMYRR